MLEINKKMFQLEIRNVAEILQGHEQKVLLEKDMEIEGLLQTSHESVSKILQHHVPILEDNVKNLDQEILFL